MLGGPITLGTVAKRHDEEIFVIALAVCVHDRVAIPAPNRTSRMDEFESRQVRRKSRYGLVKFVNRNPRFEIETGQHMKHRVPPV
jgi:hypothetical protein